MIQKVVQVALLALSAVMGYYIYNSVMAPIRFEKVKQARFTETIARLKDLRNVEDAYFVVKGNYTANHNELINFVETAKFVITTQRDTSWTAFDKTYKIDVLKQGIVVDTLGFVPVKDSLFKNSDRYKSMIYLPEFEGDSDVLKGNSSKTFNIETAILEKGNYKTPVYKISVDKEPILAGLDKEEIQKELGKTSINDVKGSQIIVGSLEEVSNSGNWPTIYDATTNAAAKK